MQYASSFLTQDVGRRCEFDQPWLLDDEAPRLAAQLDERLGERPHVHPAPRQRRLRRVRLGRPLEVSISIHIDHQICTRKSVGGVTYATFK